MDAPLRQRLLDFSIGNKFRRKGPLCVALIVTRHAAKRGLPLEPEELLTEGGGQVLGLGRSAVQAILREHGIDRVLAAEGGRTSRGSLSNMRDYVGFLNGLHQEGRADLKAIEQFWIARVLEFFATKPFKLKMDTARSLRAAIRDLVHQAVIRQKDAEGIHYAGGLLQHLVGAKLSCALPHLAIAHHSFSTADGPTARPGDFVVGDTAIHVTTSPGEAIIQKCRHNLEDGLRPVLITQTKGTVAAETLAENEGIADRIDIYEVEQFIALNLAELGGFSSKGQRAAIEEVITCYNGIVERHETDPGFRIEIA